ncbi:recombinase family protein [Kitasatospora sp. NPDC056651]|uniref:recombinase family protein n=1 Tax=Kitasatospora sp. NPDC056651 TaxID=3345892 RepID=UPI003696380F
MAEDLVTRAHWGDLTGQNWAGLVRLSFEVDADPTTASSKESSPDTETPSRRFVPMTGRDIKGRDEQEKDARLFVESRGGRYIHTYEEPDTSAWKRKRIRLPDGQVVYRVVRPVFEGALANMKEGLAPNGERLDGLIVYDIDRLTRDNRHLEDAIEVVENFRRPIIDITGTLDLLTDNGRAVARVVVAMSNKQSADTARRVRRKHRALEQAGIPTGGARPFGWQGDKRTLHPDEAPLLQKAVREIITGTPIRAIVQRWNEAGMTTPRGNVWTPGKIKQLLRNPRLCGIRSRKATEPNPVTGGEHQRLEMVYDAEGNPVPGQWDQVITVTEWEALTEIIGMNSVPGTGHNARKYLLSGILRCDRNGCGNGLRALKATPSQRKPEGFFYYACPDKGTGRGCGGGTKIAGPDTDAAVIKLVIAKYELEAAERQATSNPQPWDREEELERVREDIADLKKARKDRKITAERYFSYLAESEAEERTLLADRNKWMRSAYAAEGKPVNLRAEWEGLTFMEKRSYIEDALVAVLVAPAVGRGRPVRGRLTPVPRERD